MEGSYGATNYFEISTIDVKENDILENSEDNWHIIGETNDHCWGVMKIEVEFAYKIYFENNVIKVKTKVRGKLKTDGMQAYVLKTGFYFKKAMILTE